MRIIDTPVNEDCRKFVQNYDGAKIIMAMVMTRLAEIYMILHFLVLLCRRRSAARVACSKTSRTPSFIFAEHSRYLCAPILRATASPFISL
jgi:hypothetical protein